MTEGVTEEFNYEISPYFYFFLIVQINLRLAEFNLIYKQN